MMMPNTTPGEKIIFTISLLSIEIKSEDTMSVADVSCLMKGPQDDDGFSLQWKPEGWKAKCSFQTGTRLAPDVAPH